MPDTSIGVLSQSTAAASSGVKLQSKSNNSKQLQAHIVKKTANGSHHNMQQCKAKLINTSSASASLARDNTADHQVGKKSLTNAGGVVESNNRKAATAAALPAKCKVVSNSHNIVRRVEQKAAAAPSISCSGSPKGGKFSNSYVKQAVPMLPMQLIL